MAKRKTLSRRQLLEGANISYLSTDARRYRIVEWRDIQDMIIDGYITGVQFTNPINNQLQRKYVATEKGRQLFNQLTGG